MNPLSADAADRWRDARRVLCVRLDSIGDVLMTTPALAALKAAAPHRELSLLTSRGAAALAPHLSDIDDVLAHQASWMRNDGADDDTRLIARLAQGHYDAAVIFTVNTQSALPAALICRLAGIPLRLAHSRENPYGLLSHWQRDTDIGSGPIRHEVQRQLDLVAAAGAGVHGEQLRFQLRAQDRARFLALAAQRELCLTRPWVLIHAGANAASRRYPPEHFASVAERLWRQRGWTVVFGGDRHEQALVEQIRAQTAAPTLSLAGALDLGAYAAAIAAAPLLISNNSAPVHLAAALQTPVVGVYAATNPQHTPWSVRSRVLTRDVPCRNCLRSVCPEALHPCLRGVTADAVVAAAFALVDRDDRDLAA